MVSKSKVISLKYFFSICPNLLFRSVMQYYPCLFFWNSKLGILCFILSHHLNFQSKCFVDMFSSDFLERQCRFTSIYNLLSVVYNQRVFLNTIIKTSMSITSITAVYPNSMWYERESWDLFGILYEKNNDLRRILNDYGFKGFSLRKDFPLSGFLEVKYDYLKKSVTYEPVKLVQEFRYFDTKVPWDFHH